MIRIQSLSVKALLSLLVAFLLVIGVIAFFVIDMQLQTIETNAGALYQTRIDLIVKALERKQADLNRLPNPLPFEASYKQSILNDISRDYYGNEAQRLNALSIPPIIIDGTGNARLHPDRTEGRDVSLSGARYFKKICDEKMGQLNVRMPNGELYWIKFAYFEPWDWYVLYQVPHTLKYSEFASFRRQMIIKITALVVVMLAFIGFGVSRYFVRPITSLSAAAKAFESGDTTQTINTARNDEIGQLAKSFSAMRESINRQVGLMKEENEKRAKAEADAIRQSDALREKLEVISAQQEAIRKLTTPVLEIGDGLIALPIVGYIDTQRASEMTDDLLEKVIAMNARGVIVDITGIDVIDTKTADHFIKMAKAVRMLGATAVITGISPAIAQTLTHIDVDLVGISTLRTLKDGMIYLLRRNQERDRADATVLADAEIDSTDESYATE